MPKRPACVIIAAMLSIAGCSVFVSPPQHVESGPEVVCFLHNGSAFKKAVVEQVTVELAVDGYTVITGDPKRAKYYDAADYGAVVYMADYWMWHVPFHQKAYYAKNGEPANVVFVITSGDPDVTVTKPFDAITSASKDDRIEPVAALIIARLGKILP